MYYYIIIQGCEVTAFYEAFLPANKINTVEYQVSTMHCKYKFFTSVKWKKEEANLLMHRLFEFSFDK
jgi:hypothetical protein